MMGVKITNEQKKIALKTLEEHGTMIAAAKAANVGVKTLRAEMKRSAIFRKRVIEARSTGQSNVGDSALAVIEMMAFGEQYSDPKYSKARLTAAIALANAFIPGFKGTTTIQGHVDHDFRVVTAIPRPKYIEESRKQIPPPQNVIDVTPINTTVRDIVDR